MKQIKAIRASNLIAEMQAVAAAPLREPRTKDEAIQYLANSASLLRWQGFEAGAEQIEAAIAWINKQA